MSNSAHLEHPRKRRGLLLLISSPSGAGKTSLTRRLVADHADLRCRSRPRPASRGRASTWPRLSLRHRRRVRRHGAERAFLLEWAEVYGNRYGSPRAPIMAALERARSVLFDIDFQGAKQIARPRAGRQRRVFVLPPSWPR
jgi:guanylate kinase